MSKPRDLKRIDVTARKSNKIEFLQRQVNNASSLFAKTEAKYNSFVEKAAVFEALYAEAEAELKTAEAYWEYFLQIKSDLDALKQSGDEANLVAVDALSDVSQLIIGWEEVTTETLKAAEAITLMADYIQKRKASNPLISNDLVNDAVAAAKASVRTVKTVVKAYADALQSLSPATQTAHSTGLTNEYINLAIAQSLEEKASTELLLLLEEEGAIVKKEEILIEQKQSLEFSLAQSLEAAQTKAALALKASENANKEMNKAKEELAQAQAALETWQAALAAAETAVAG